MKIIREDFSFSALINANRSFIMGIAMISILLFHQTFENEGVFWRVFQCYGEWGVDIFLLLSGMGMTKSLSNI